MEQSVRPMLDPIDYIHPDLTKFGVEGERMLWMSVLWFAVKDISEARTLREAEGVRCWFYSTQDDAGSFIWICSELGLEPGYWRTRANRIFQRRVEVGKAIPFHVRAYRWNNTNSNLT